jgi:ferrous iron transport protein B
VSLEATIALAGNPNSGKSTLFNALTGARQRVGNYPGVTVEKKAGRCEHHGVQLNIVDLPGTYSLTAYSPEEVVARDFLVDQRPALVVHIVDAANLERNLYLTIQLLELGVPVAIALNMIDVAAERGIRIAADKLAQLLGVPVVPTVARSGKGREALMAAAAAAVANQAPINPLFISYGRDVDPLLSALSRRIEAAGFLTRRFPARWTALKYLESDEQVRALGAQADPRLHAELEAAVARLAAHLQETADTYPEAVIADQRYGFIKSLLKQGVVAHTGDLSRLFLSDQIDRVATQRFVGPLIMAAVVWGLYHFTFGISKTPVAWVEGFFEWLKGLAGSHLADGLLKSLITSGIIDGAGGVLGFTPLIMFMFLGISLLEDSGYLARVAFMLDRVFRAFGLHGSSVMAFVVSGGIAGGCAVPGVMATRTLKSPRERLATLLTAPFMNCGAKLPVFALLTAAFFASHEALVMLAITAAAWAGALLVAKLLRTTVIRGASTPFVMELPPYRLPTLKGLLIHTGERTWQYIKKAGTVILAISILLWAMMTFPQLPEEVTAQFEERRAAVLAAAPAEVADEIEALDKEAGEGGELSEQAQAVKEQMLALEAEKAGAALEHSIAGRIGRAFEGVSGLAGFDWRTNIALVGGFAAKEVVVSTLGTAHSLGEVDPEESGSLAEKLAEAPGWRPLSALSLIVFTMFYAPCFVSVVCISREAGSWRWGAFAVVFNTLLAFSLAVLVYQTGSALGF